MSYLAKNMCMNRLVVVHRIQKQMAQLIVPVAQVHGRKYIGKRDVVGYGMNGTYDYIDHCAHPYPAIRFKEEIPDISKLLEKGKQDWSKLSLEEKKTLYRHNFCLTLSEVDAPNAEWKGCLAIVIFLSGLTLFYFATARKYFFGPLPSTMTPEGKQITRDLEIKYKANPIFGLASKFDYEKGDWK